MSRSLRRWISAVLALVVMATIAGCQRGEPVAEIRATPTSAAAPVSAAGTIAEPDPKDWPCWRGADQTGVAEGSAPIEWSATKNVLWGIAVPGHGHASPILWGEQVFIATA